MSERERERWRPGEKEWNYFLWLIFYFTPYIHSLMHTHTPTHTHIPHIYIHIHITGIISVLYLPILISFWDFWINTIFYAHSTSCTIQGLNSLLSTFKDKKSLQAFSCHPGWKSKRVEIFCSLVFLDLVFLIGWKHHEKEQRDEK